MLSWSEWIRHSSGKADNKDETANVSQTRDQGDPIADYYDELHSGLDEAMEAEQSMYGEIEEEEDRFGWNGPYRLQRQQRTPRRRLDYRHPR